MRFTLALPSNHFQILRMVSESQVWEIGIHQDGDMLRLQSRICNSDFIPIDFLVTCDRKTIFINLQNLLLQMELLQEKISMREIFQLFPLKIPVNISKTEILIENHDFRYSHTRESHCVAPFEIRVQKMEHYN